MVPPRDDWLSTVWQTAPRLFELAGNLEPTLHVDAATALDDRFLEAHADAALIDAAIDELQAAPRSAVFMVGDQYFTDIAGANLAGIASVKVRTVHPESFPIAVRCLQQVERALFRVLTLAKRGQTPR
jgi:predicted HAD superfamily phosphohydrolase YqeG